MAIAKRTSPLLEEIQNFENVPVSIRKIDVKRWLHIHSFINKIIESAASVDAAYVVPAFI
jgi:hypothetical protein